jgi:membrane-associated protease RseP (regulator of RpoE activity)
MAGWVGLLITSLNLFPIGQLDGGHILYALLRRRAHFVAKAVVAACVAAVVLFGYVWWVLMLGLVLFLGPSHPPTADDEASLGPLRILLGWLCLGFLIFGFTPNPGAADTIGLIDLLRLW